MELLALLQLLNAASPVIGSLIVAIKHTDGSLSATVILDQADANFAANQKQVSDWLAAHQTAAAAKKA